MTTLRIALEWYLNPDHLPLIAARDMLADEGIRVELIVPDDHYDGFDGLADGSVDLVVNEPLHLVERRALPLRAHGCFFATDGGVLMHRASLARLAAGDPIRIASPVSNPTTDRLCRDILAGWANTRDVTVQPDQVSIEEAGFAHVDNLMAGYDGAWLAFANVEGVDARMRGIDAVMVTTAQAGIPDFSALELIGRADAAGDILAGTNRLAQAIGEAVTKLRADPDAARATWYRASGEAPSPTTDAIVADTLTRLVSPVLPDAARWRPMWRYMHDAGGDVVAADVFEAMFID